MNGTRIGYQAWEHGSHISLALDPERNRYAWSNISILSNDNIHQKGSRPLKLITDRQHPSPPPPTRRPEIRIKHNVN